jgi:hypothetical protein
MLERLFLTKKVIGDGVGQIFNHIYGVSHRWWRASAPGAGVTIFPIKTQGLIFHLFSTWVIIFYKFFGQLTMLKKDTITQKNENLWKIVFSFYNFLQGLKTVKADSRSTWHSIANTCELENPDLLRNFKIGIDPIYSTYSCDFSKQFVDINFMSNFHWQLLKQEIICEKYLEVELPNRSFFCFLIKL